MLQQLGLPQIRVAHVHNQNLNPNRVLPELRDMPLRPLIAPIMMMLLSRTLLPRQPVFAILVIAWTLYEIWRPIRDGLVRGLRRGINDRARQDVPLQQDPPHNPFEGPRLPQNFLGAFVGGRGNNQAAAAVLDTVASLNIPTEEQILSDAPGAVIREPGFGHKFFTFLSLFVLTIHPAVWNQRRAALRRREGRIRTEENVRNSSTAEAEGEEGQIRAQTQTELRARYARHPRWIQDYVARVVASDWVDDAD